MGRTIAEALEAKGEKKGELSGLKKALLLQLREQFDDVPEHVVETIQKTTDVKQINVWLKRVLGAQSVDDLGIISD